MLKRTFQRLLSRIHKLKDGRGIVICGWVSSGSTLVYQVVRSLGFKPVSIHGTPNFYSPKVIFTFRAQRDITHSWARRHFGPLYQETPQEAIARAIDFIIDAGYDRDYEKARHSPNFLAIRCEGYFGGRESYLVKFLADQLGCPITDQEAKEIHDKNSLRRNAERASEVKDFTTWDEKSLIHGNHVSNKGKIGG